MVVNAQDDNLSHVLTLGCWSRVEYFGAQNGWQAMPRNPEASRFQVLYEGKDQGDIAWELIGHYNMTNALAAIAAARHAGAPVKTAVAALEKFRNVKRRLEVRGAIRGITVYDDFAHHPTAIAGTLQALRARVGNKRILAVLELRSNTMRMGVHRDTLGGSLTLADRVLMLKPADINWNLERVTSALNGRGEVYDSVQEIIDALAKEAHPDDQVLIMSNGGFDNIHARLLERLQTQRSSL